MSANSQRLCMHPLAVGKAIYNENDMCVMYNVVMLHDRPSILASDPSCCKCICA